MVTPHDDLFHFTFQQLRHAAAWLRWLLPAAVVRATDWLNLRPAPEKLRGHALRLSIADLVFEARRCGNGGPVWFVPEHKAHHDADVERQLLRYAVHLGDRARGDAGPAPVVAVLLHHGDQPFVPAEPDAADPFAAFQPRLPFVRRRPAARERSEPARTRTHAARNPDVVVPALPARPVGRRDPEVVRTLGRVVAGGRPRRRAAAGRDAISAIARYALCVVEVPHQDLHEAFERLLQRPEETIMSTAEKLRREGFAQGRAEALLRQLSKRFGEIPAGTAERVRAGTIAELDLWLDRVLDAHTLADVFAG